jgi:integrase/recombinase XerD
MIKFNAENERIKRRYLTFVHEAQGYSIPSVDGVAKAIARFETFTGYRDFKTYQDQQAVDFKRHLMMQKNSRTGEPLSLSTVHSTLKALRNFFRWLAAQSGYKSKFTYNDAEYFNLPDKEARVARARRESPGPTIEQMKAVLAAMPAGTVIERRDRAVVATAVLTGARDGALASLKMKHIDIHRGSLFQDAREVKTKNSKTFTSWFFPVPGEFRSVVECWVRELREELLWGDDDPLFPATETSRVGNNQFGVIGLKRTCWSGAQPIRDIFRRAFAGAGLPYFNPHLLRKTLALFGEGLCHSAEEMKAWSQNLGHDDVGTTFSSYGLVPSERQREIIAGLAVQPASNPKAQELFNQLVRAVQSSGLLPTKILE